MSESKKEPIAGVIYPCSFYVQKKESKKWMDRGVYDSCVKMDNNLEIDEYEFMCRRAMFKKGADNKNIDKFRVIKVEVDYDTPLCREEFLINAI